MISIPIFPLFNIIFRLIIYVYHKCSLLLGYSIVANTTSVVESDEMSAEEHVWFDGVDKKLLEMNSIQAKPIEVNDQTLLTKTPLTKFSSYAKKRKEKQKDEQDKTNGIEKKRKKLKPEKATGSADLRPKDAILPNTGLTDEVAMDCEMVECFHHQSVLARVSIVNIFGHPILDKFVAPPSKVTDYRTKWSGIRKKDLEGAPDFETVQQEVADIIRGRIVVGHAVHNDFAVLKINHPPDKIRDTSKYFKYLFQGKSPSLKKLSECLLGVKIQKGEHDSVQDAQATMKLYVKERDKWNERLLAEKNGNGNSHHNHPTNGHRKQKKVPKKKKMKTFYVMTT